MRRRNDITWQQFRLISAFTARFLLRTVRKSGDGEYPPSHREAFWKERIPVTVEVSERLQVSELLHYVEKVYG